MAEILEEVVAIDPRAVELRPTGVNHDDMQFGVFAQRDLAAGVYVTYDIVGKNFYAPDPLVIT